MPWLRDARWIGILASALLVHACARGGWAWVLGFVAFVPWLLTLAREPTAAKTLLSAYGMSVAYSAAALGWFASAIDSYTHIGTPAAWAVLLLAAPVLQPQFLAFALVRHATGKRHGPLLRALAGASAWVAAEWLVPKLLGDTFAVGLYPSPLMRQAADIGGVAGLTFMLLLANEGIAVAIARRKLGARAIAAPLALATLVPLALAAYGASVLSDRPTPGQPLRMGLVQSNITDYERMRRERGAGAVVREVLDTHYAMSYDAVERQRVDAVLWSETVYPTTFARPKSEAGAELDREIVEIVNAAGVPFVFGTYDRDERGEYNAAAFVAPGQGLVGFYRKSRPFPLTEYVPQWLDSASLRQWLPWAGTWRPGDGARVLPLRLRGGREVPVLPMICLDDMDTALAVQGARLGAQAIVTLSNDSWFTRDRLGVQLHQAAAAFRSIETRLPQFRVTTNGFSAVIDDTGALVATSRMGERALVVGELPVRDVPPTLVVRWGDWVGRAGAVFLLLLAAAWAFGRYHRGHAMPADTTPSIPIVNVSVLPPLARWIAAALRVFARASLLVMAAALAAGDGPLATNHLAQARAFAFFVLAPEAVAWLVLRAFSARATLEGVLLVMVRGTRQLTLPLREIMAIEPWRLPVPGPGASLRLADGSRWRYGISHANPFAFARGLNIPVQAGPGLADAASVYLDSRMAARRGWLHHPLVKFAVLPLALAIPAFRLHQYIAYGSAFGEYYQFGLLVYMKGFMLWWGAWAAVVAACAAVLRVCIEAAAMCVVFFRASAARNARYLLERAGTALLYLGAPAAFALRTLPW